MTRALDQYQPLAHWLAVLIAVATFPLICMGGLVTSLHAGMSVPDWPNSYGYNMFLFPPNRWVGGIFYEHTHRLMGTVVGMLSIGLVIFSWRSKFRSLALWVLAAVIFQGVLGGLRVVLVKLNLAIVHACVAQAFFCLAGYAALVTSKWWMAQPRLRAAINARGLFWLGVATVAVVYLQLMVGATMRHYDAGLAIADVPFVYGKWLPPISDAGLNAINHTRAFELGLDPVTLAQIWLAFAHRCGAALVTCLVLIFAHKLFWRRDASGVKTWAVLLVLLLATQITLGVLTVLWRKPADIASLHVAVGALVLLTSFLLTMRVARITEVDFAQPWTTKFLGSASSLRFFRGTGLLPGVRSLFSVRKHGPEGRCHEKISSSSQAVPVTSGETVRSADPTLMTHFHNTQNSAPG